MNPQIIQIQPLENGLGFQATFADGSIKLYNELIAVDFDGEANASYNNSQLGMAVDGITLNAAVDAASQAAILDKLNADAAEDVLYINAADAAELPKTSYSTIYVGDTDAFAAYGNFAGIAETTGAFAASTKGDNAFVLTGANFSTDALAATIAHEAGHLMGTVEHDYGMDGITLDDFGTAFTERVTQTTNIVTEYTGSLTAISQSGAAGGGVWIASGEMTISQANIHNGFVNWGGAISAHNLSNFRKLTVSNSTLENNRAYYGGGAVNFSDGDSSASINFNTVTFRANTSGLITGTTDNLQYRTGGAIFAHHDNVNITVNNSVFEQNYSILTGGAISFFHGSVTINSSTFTNNKATTNGGALYLSQDDQSGNTPTANVTGCTFNGNTAALGGAAYINNGKATFTNCKFLTVNDTIYTAHAGAEVKFAGSNTFAANVSRSAAGGVIQGLGGEEYVFIDASTITNFQVELGTGSTMTFDKVTSGKIAFGNLMNQTNVTTTNVITGTDKIGDITQVASNVGWLTAGSSTINYNDAVTQVSSDNLAEVKLAAGTLSVGYRFNGRAADSTDTTLKFVESHYEEGFGTVTLGCGKTVTGNAATGDASTELNGKIYANGKSLEMSSLKYSGIIYGANSTNEDVSNAIDLKFSDMTFTDGNTNSIYGGGYASSNGKVTLSGATVTMSNVTLGQNVSIYGGGVLAAGNLETGNIALTLGTTASSTGHSGNVYAGVYDNTAATGSGITLGTVSTTITSGSYNLVGNGSRITKASSTQGTSTLNISGGTFASYVYGGAFNYGSNATATVSGDVNFTISGGTFNGLVFGGCAAQNSQNAANTTITGNVNLTINATTSNIVFNKTVYAGSEGNGVINGNVNVTFTGDASKITWSSTGVAISGGNQYKSAKATKGSVLNFDDFNGNFSGKIQNRFDSMVLTHDSDITFTSNTILDEISDWTIDANCSLKWTGNGSCDFENDTINITDTGLAAGTYYLFDLGAAGSLTGWGGDNMTVNFGSTEITGASGVYTGTLGSYNNCELSKQDNKIQLVIA